MCNEEILNKIRESRTLLDTINYKEEGRLDRARYQRKGILTIWGHIGRGRGKKRLKLIDDIERLGHKRTKEKY